MESTIQELEIQLKNAQINADNSLRAEGVVGEKFKQSQREMTKRHYELIGSLRKRIQEKVEEQISQNNN